MSLGSSSDVVYPKVCSDVLAEEPSLRTMAIGSEPEVTAAEERGEEDDMVKRGLSSSYG